MGAMSALLRAVVGTAVVVVLSAAVAGAADARKLIAPLDVRVTPKVVSGTELKGAYNVYPVGNRGAWIGPEVRLTETWAQGRRTSVRVRGRAAGGPRKRHFLDVAYLRYRKGSGSVREAEENKQDPLVLICAAQGVRGQNDTHIDSLVTSMQIIDDPRRNRVIIRGPGIAFLGPICMPYGYEMPFRTMPIHPPDPKRLWAPQGALDPWELTIPRAEFAAGGTFRFRGQYSLGTAIENNTTMDIAGTQLTSGKVAIDLDVRRLGR
jgi:hypothetical protein